MKKLIGGGIAAATVTGALMFAAPAQADVFTTCPSGHTGVVGGHTSCSFAENISRAYWASGGASSFIAFSPVTGARYVVNCSGNYPAYFVNGQTMMSTNCYAGDNAQAVIW